MSIIANIGSYYSSDIIYIGGMLMTIFLIISIITVLLLVDTKFWNTLVENTISAVSICMLLVFILILSSKVIFKLVMTI